MFLLLALTLVLSLVNAKLDFTLIDLFGPACFIFLLADVYLLIHLLVYFNKDYAATNGAFQWIWFSWTMLIKLLLYYYVVFWTYGEEEKLRAQQLEDDLSFQLAIFSMPLLFAMWMLRGAYQLFGPVNKVFDVETFVHMDILFHVVVDLLDLSFAFTLIYKARSLRTSDSWLLHVNGVMMGVSWFLHSYSFPTGSSQIGRADASGSSKTESDVFLTRKHAALVSIFLVDIPQLLVRAYLWINYPTSPGLQAFVFKNILDIPLSTFRLNQCRVIERERTKVALQTDEAAEYRSTESSEVLSSSENSSEDGDGSLKEELTVRKRGLHFTADGQKLLNLLDQLESVRSIPVKGIRFGDVAKRVWRCIVYSGRHSYPSRLNHVPELPRRYQYSLLFPIYARALYDMACVLLHVLPREDCIALRSRWYVIMVCAAAGPAFVQFLCTVKTAPLLDVLSCSVWTMSRCVTFWCITRALKSSNLFNLEIPSDYFQTDSNVTEIVFICLLSSKSICRCVFFFPYIFHVFNHVSYIKFLLPKSSIPFHPRSVYTTSSPEYLSSTLTKKYQTTKRHTQKHQQAFSSHQPTAHSQQNRNRELELDLKAGGEVHGVKPDANASQHKLIPEQAGNTDGPEAKFLGLKEQVINRSPIPSSESESPEESSLEDEFEDVSSNRASSLSEEVDLLPLDERGLVSLSSILIFLNCKYRLAPTAYQELLMGSDIIKSIRLADVLLTRDWLQLLLSSLVKGAAFVMKPEFLSIAIFSFDSLLFLFHLLASQAIRLLVLRRYEVQALFASVLEVWEAAPPSLQAAAAGTVFISPEDAEAALEHWKSEMRRANDPKFITLNDVAQNIKLDGFFTSPGEVLPPVI